MLSCPDEDISTGAIVHDSSKKTKPKKSLRKITLKKHSERLSVLTDSNLKFTYYLKRQQAVQKEAGE